jgi:predicted nuclease with TOPRIM domain
LIKYQIIQINDSIDSTAQEIVKEDQKENPDLSRLQSFREDKKQLREEKNKLLEEKIKLREEINQLKATLESPEFTRYIRITGKDFSGGYKSITTKQIKNFAFGEMKKFDLFS